MAQYNYHRQSIASYLQRLYNDGLKKSIYLNDTQVQILLERIGIFKFKGYLYAFKPHIQDYSIDEVFVLFFFDKYLSRLLMDMTSSIETKLKSALIESSYKQLNSLPRTHPLKDNPFFYLIQSCYVNPNPKLIGPSVNNWKNMLPMATVSERYIHYGRYYQSQYDFASNKVKYLDSLATIPLQDSINYPPLHYFVEGSVLGTIIYLIKHLQINNVSIMPHVARKFGITNPRIDFIPYLERLNEVRNRAAHRERLFNRSYRSVTRLGKYRKLSQGIRDHGFMDVYLFLFFMMDSIDNYADFQQFKHEEIERLFEDFVEDYYIQKDSMYLTKKFKKDLCEKMRNFILRGMQ